MDITGEVIKSAIAKKLSENFTCPIYKEKIVQGFATPCLFISLDSVKQTSQLNGFVLREFEICVTYYPEENSNTPYEDCSITGNILTELLRTIEAGNIIRGRSSNFNASESVMNFRLTYPVRLKRVEEEAIKMQKITQQFAKIQ